MSKKKKKKKKKKKCETEWSGMKKRNEPGFSEWNGMRMGKREGKKRKKEEKRGKKNQEEKKRWQERGKKGKKEEKGIKRKKCVDLMPFLTTWKAKDVEKASFGHFCRVEKCGKKDVDFDRNAKASKRWDFHGHRSKFLVLGCVDFEENGNKRIVRWSKNDSYETPKSPFSRGFGLPFCEKKEVFGLSLAK